MWWSEPKSFFWGGVTLPACCSLLPPISPPSLLSSPPATAVRSYRDVRRREHVLVEHRSESCVWYVWALGFGGADGRGAGYIFWRIRRVWSHPDALRKTGGSFSDRDVLTLCACVFMCSSEGANHSRCPGIKHFSGGLWLTGRLDLLSAPWSAASWYGDTVTLTLRRPHSVCLDGGSGLDLTVYHMAGMRRMVFFGTLFHCSNFSRILQLCFTAVVLVKFWNLFTTSYFNFASVDYTVILTINKDEFMKMINSWKT